MTIVNFNVRCMLVDNGSSIYIIYWDAFKQMDITADKFEPLLTPLFGFVRYRVLPERCITLPITAKDGPNQSTIMVRYFMVKCLLYTMSYLEDQL